MFNDVYVHGDKDAVNAEIILLCAVAYNDEVAKNNIDEMLSENTHFYQGFNNFLSVFKTNRKLKNTLIK